MCTSAGVSPPVGVHGPCARGLGSADFFKTLFKVSLNRPYRTLIFCHSSMSGGLAFSTDPQRAFSVHQRGTEVETRGKDGNHAFRAGHGSAV